MDVQSIITQNERNVEQLTGAKTTDHLKNGHSNPIPSLQGINHQPLSNASYIVHQRNQNGSNNNNNNFITITNSTNGNHEKTTNIISPTAKTTTATTTNISNHGQIIKSPTVKQSNRSFLSQLLCCFRPPPSCAYYQDSVHTEQNSIFDRRFREKYLLPLVKRSDKICMVIDLDETLVHSSFKPIDNADFVVPVDIDGAIHQVYVLKRPYVDEFLQRMGQLYECILFTASLAKYADPVADLLDKKNIFKARLFRESCSFYKGNYVKDLSRLGRDLNRVIIVDNSPASYIFHPDNAVPVASWFDDMSDTELRDLIPLFERLSKVHSVLEGVKQNKLISQISSTLGRQTAPLQALPYAPIPH